jgi:hypothetical protein
MSIDKWHITQSASFLPFPELQPVVASPVNSPKNNTSAFRINRRLQMQGTTQRHLFRALEPVIELALAQTTSRAAYIYRFDGESERAILAAHSGPSPAAGAPSLTFDGPLFAYHRHRNTPIVLQDEAWKDRRFSGLPEFQAHRFEGVVSAPLVDGGSVSGIVNFCRTESGVLRGRELSLLLELSVPLATLLNAPVLREQLDRTMKQLEDRKFVERAKGLLQESMGLTEEQAYLHLRLESRRRRTPMREIAERLIQDFRRGADTRVCSVETRLDALGVSREFAQDRASS